MTVHTIGRMTVTFDENVSAAKRAAILKGIEAAPARYRREQAKYLKADPPAKPLRAPSVAMLEDTGTIGSWPYVNRERPILVMPEDVRREGVVKLARGRYKVWLKDPKGDPVASKWTPEGVSRRLASLTDADLERLIESNIQPGGRLVAQFAGTLVEAWDERERRKDLALEVAS